MKEVEFIEKIIQLCKEYGLQIKPETDYGTIENMFLNVYELDETEEPYYLKELESYLKTYENDDLPF